MRAAATFAAAYGCFPPGTWEQEGAAIGLMANATRVRATRSIDMARAIGAAIGGGEAAADLMRDAGASVGEILRVRMAEVREQANEQRS